MGHFVWVCIIMSTICKDQISFGDYMAEKPSKIKGFEGFRLLFRGTKNTKKIPLFPPFVPFLSP